MFLAACSGTLQRHRHARSKAHKPLSQQHRTLQRPCSGATACQSGVCAGCRCKVVIEGAAVKVVCVRFRVLLSEWSCCCRVLF